MKRFLSFRMVRNLGLGVLTSLILVVSLFAFFMLKRVDDKIGLVLEKERLSLDTVLKIQNNFIKLYPHFQRYIAGQLDSYQHIPWIIGNVEQHLAAAKIDLPPAERKHLYKFAMTLKSLKFVLKSYNEELQYDPTSSNSEELIKIVHQKMHEATAFLNIITANIRRRMQLMNMEILQGIQKDRQLLFMFLLVAVILGLAIMVIINRALSMPVQQLMEGAKRIGEGNLNWRIKLEHRDEFGQLAESFNKMSQVLQDRNHKLDASYRELEGYKNRLEEKVKERTAELHTALEQLKTSQQQLVRSERLATIGQLASSIAHELRNPLGGMKNALYYVKGKLLPSPLAQDNPRTVEFLELIEEEIDNSSKIISDLLEFSRTRKLTLSPTRINGIIEDTLKRQELSDNIKLIKELDSHLLPIPLDSDQMCQVFINLIQNAHAAMPQGGELRVRTGEQNGQVQIDFSDTGSGIPPQIMEKIFSPLFTTKAKGIGLGLAVCQGIVERHGGKIRVESKVDQGTRFSITLPVKMRGANNAA